MCQQRKSIQHNLNQLVTLLRTAPVTTASAQTDIPFYDTAVGDENTEHVVDNENIAVIAYGIKWVRAMLDSPPLNASVPQ
jgi:hypothetical protein